MKLGIKEGLMTDIKKLSVINELVNTIFIDSKTEDVYITNCKKVKNIEVTELVKVKPSLKSKKFIVKTKDKSKIIISNEIKQKTINCDCLLSECVSSRINREFIESIENFNNLEKITYKFLNLNFLERFLFRRTKIDFIRKIIKTGENFKWCLVSKEAFDIIKDSNYFKLSKSNSNSYIRKVGNLILDDLNIEVYLSDDINKNNVYFGNKKSVNLILKNQFDIKKVKNSIDSTTISISIEYDIISSGRILLMKI